MKRWKRLYGMSGTFTCPFCLRTLPISEASIDHRLPSGRNGKTTPENTRVVCKYDNHKKGMLTDEEYRLFLLLDKIRNGDKSVEKIQRLEYIIYVLNKHLHKGL